MDKFTLTQKEILELHVAHRVAKTKRDADRIKAIVLLGKGWTIASVAEALLLDDETLRNYIKRYQTGGINELLQAYYLGGDTKLTQEELNSLDEHLQQQTYMRVADIVVYVEKTYKVVYSVSGMTDLLARLEYVYKKPKLIPGKANRKEQEKFLRKYNNIKKSKGKSDPIYFIDGTHPQHNTVAAYGWIKKGKDKELRTNTGRGRLNINGALNIEELKVVARFEETINAQSVLRLFQQLEKAHPLAKTIYCIADNAPYYRSKIVKKYIRKSKIKLVFLPPYSPNLNLIERLWKFFKKQVLYNKYYEKFDEYKASCIDFFKNIKRYKSQLRTLLTENFEILGT